MKIINKEILNDAAVGRIIRIEVSSLDIARKVEPGQFVVLMASEEGERVPLTVVDADKHNGVITLIFQEAGLTTGLLGKLNPGDSLYALAGPLGHPTEIKHYGKVIVVGGGVGIAEIYPVARAFKKAGNRITTILGARSKDLLILSDELKSVSDDFYTITDDGSCGRKGFTTDILQELLSRDKYDLVYAVGPLPMMRKVSVVAGGFGTKTIVSLNAIMVDGTGMCGCCRVTVAGEVKFSCVDGPEFQAQAVDWDELMKRNAVYADKEKHICKLKAV
ncbi:MAG: sulfide/dihydroorotate dehydrogenase-like FAD/NAD-binding protein [Candidatus Omnitrophota bacterium]